MDPSRPFTRRQALDAGWARADIDTALRRGVWTRIRPGTYVEAATYRAAESGAEVHLLRAAAELAALPDDHVVSHRSAAVAHGLPLLGGTPARPLLSRAPRSSRDAATSRWVRVVTLPEEEVVEVDGLRVTSLARTVVDLARHEGRQSAKVAADAALASGLAPDELLAVAERCRSWPGGKDAVAVLRLADARAESPLESISHLLFHDEGLPAPELQVEIRNGSGRVVARVDFLWRAQHVVGEVDGMAKYRSVLDLRRETVREDELRSAGLEVVRGGWNDATRRGPELCARIRDAFLRSAARAPLPTDYVLPPAA